MGGRVAAAASWVHTSGGVNYAVTVQNVGGGRFLGKRDGGSESSGDDIYSSGGMKGCASGREDVRGCVVVGCLAEEPAAANILHRDGIINAAADVHPRRRRCNPP